MDAVTRLLGWPLFSIGDTQTTVGSLLAVIGTGVVTLLVGRLTRKSVDGLVLKTLQDDDDVATGAYGVLAQLCVYIVGLEIALHLLGLRLSTLLAASGFLALGAGFALKNIVENFLSGGILRAEKTIRPGDLIVVEDKWLFVRRIGTRTTIALTYDGEEVLIPNSLLAQSMVTNLTRNNRLHRIELGVGVTYDSDLVLVRKTLEDTAHELEWRSTAKKPAVYLAEFGNSSVKYAVDVWIDDANNSRSRRSELHEAVWRALKDKGIRIAFPQLDVHVDKSDIDAMSRQ